MTFYLETRIEPETILAHQSIVRSKQRDNLVVCV